MNIYDNGERTVENKVRYTLEIEKAKIKTYSSSLNLN